MRCRFNKGKSIKAVAVFLLAAMLFTAVCALTWYIASFMSGRSIEASGEKVAGAKYPTIVIDAGHGGRDSGAVGVDGSLEKEINLDVSKRLYELCRLAGLECVMTRSEDVMLVDDSVTSHRKMHDLKNRLAAAESADNGNGAVLVSIHMNKFSDPKYSGLQVWYSPSDKRSAELAAYVQSYARTWLDTDNDRETKRATSSIYILDRAKQPAVLVECGFLSNPEECSRLGTDEYRQELAVTLFAAICGWLEVAAE